MTVPTVIAGQVMHKNNRRTTVAEHVAPNANSNPGGARSCLTPTIYNCITISRRQYAAWCPRTTFVTTFARVALVVVGCTASMFVWHRSCGATWP